MISKATASALAGSTRLRRLSAFSRHQCDGLMALQQHVRAPKLVGINEDSMEHAEESQRYDGVWAPFFGWCLNSMAHASGRVDGWTA